MERVCLPRIQSINSLSINNNNNSVLSLSLSCYATRFCVGKLTVNKTLCVWMTHNHHRGVMQPATCNHTQRDPHTHHASRKAYLPVLVPVGTTNRSVSGEKRTWSARQCVTIRSFVRSFVRSYAVIFARRRISESLR